MTNQSSSLQPSFWDQAEDRLSLPAYDKAMDRSETDRVNHPSHYTAHPSGVECIQVTEWMNFNLGNAVKYIWRADLKSTDPLEDLKKAKWYIEREIRRLEGVAPDTLDLAVGFVRSDYDDPRQPGQVLGAEQAYLSPVSRDRDRPYNPLSPTTRL